MDDATFQGLTVYGPLGLACLAEGWVIRVLWTALRELSTRTAEREAATAAIVERNTAALSAMTEIVKEGAKR